MTARVSVITPSFNQARFLEENLASVRAQGGCVLEHIVMDGGSTDGTRELLERSAGVAWVSERDRGQSDALAKGLARARGEIIGWLNSDDLYCEGAVARAVALLDADPGLAMVFGHCRVIDEVGRPIGSVDAYDVDLEGMLSFGTIPQPSCFLRRSAIDLAGGIDVSLRYAMDYDLWLRIGLAGGRWRAVDEYWAEFRIHGASKTGSEGARFLPEVEGAMERALGSASLPPGLARRRPAIRARFHKNIARAAYANLDLATARSRFLQAARVDPFALDRATLVCAAKAFLPLPMVVAARKISAAARQARAAVGGLSRGGGRRGRGKRGTSRR